MNSEWFPLEWPPASQPSASNAPRAVLSLAALGDMPVKPQPSPQTLAEIEKVFPDKRFVWLTQEHSRTVLSADSADTAGQSGDGLVTNDGQTLIGVTVADCMPIFLWDTALGARALCHSGWKGTGIVRQALSLMKARFGSQPAAIRAILGPSIRPCCYAVPLQRAEAFAAEFGQGAAVSRGGQWYIDLAAANKSLLAAEGVYAVHAHGECTCCDTRFSSYRRQGENLTLMLALCGAAP